MKSELLHVVTPFENVMRWDSRERLFRDFQQHMLDSGVRLHVVDLAHGNRPWIISEVRRSPHVDYIQKRCRTVLWHKENEINQGFMHVPSGAAYIAWIDGDVRFTDPHWAREAVEALQEHPVIQPWSDALDMGPCGDEVIKHHRSFAAQYAAGATMGNVEGGRYTFAHPGYAWCARRDFLEATGGLIERAILGAADHHMALAMIGQADKSIKKGVTEHYRRMIISWQDRALAAGGLHLGAIEGNTIVHHWHGEKARRRYVERWQILIRNHYDPERDIVRNLDGIFELAGNKPHLERDILRYFRQRNEDSNTHHGDGHDHGGRDK